MKKKGEFEFNQLPVLINEDGESLAQSKAILRYLGMRFGYYSTEDPEEMYIIDSTIDAINDVWEKT